MQRAIINNGGTEGKIIGWEIIVYTTLPTLGTVRDYRIEYGNSPVRDRKSRLDKIQELMSQGRDIEVNAIRRVKS